MKNMKMKYTLFIVFILILVIPNIGICGKFEYEKDRQGKNQKEEIEWVRSVIGNTYEIKLSNERFSMYSKYEFKLKPSFSTERIIVKENIDFIVLDLVQEPYKDKYYKVILDLSGEQIVAYKDVIYFNPLYWSSLNRSVSIKSQMNDEDRQTFMSLNDKAKLKFIYMNDEDKQKLKSENEAKIAEDRQKLISENETKIAKEKKKVKQKKVAQSQKENIAKTKEKQQEQKQTLSSAYRGATDYEHDLTERCKDWIYYRNKAYKLGRQGDQKGSEKARIAMLTFDRDLHKYFTEKQISDEIARLEASGYKVGF